MEKDVFSSCKKRDYKESNLRPSDSARMHTARISRISLMFVDRNKKDGRL